VSAAAVQPAEPQQTEAVEEAHEVDESSIVADIFPELANDEEPEKPSKAKAKPAKQEEPEEDEAEDQIEEPAAEEQTDPFSLLRLDALFDDKTLSTKQGIAKARDTVLQARKAARELHQTANDAHLRAKRHEQQAKARVSEANRAMRAAQALEARVQADIDTAFNSGDANAVADALSRLTKRDAHKLYEQWTEVQIGKKKAEGVKDPRLDKVLEELGELKKSKQTEEEQRQQAIVEQKRQKWLAGLDADVQANAETYRTVSYLLTLPGKAAELAEHVDELARGHFKATGEWPSNAQILQHVENELRPLVRVPKRQDPAEKTGASTKRIPGRGVSPTLGAQRSHAKTLDEMTQEEREAKLAEDADEILSGLGLV
jgi:hypothetical protein